MGRLEEFNTAVSQRRYSEEEVRGAIRNMIVDGCEIQPGHDVLILNENGVTEPVIADLIEDECRSLGARVFVMWADTVTGPEDIPETLVRAFERPDVTIFNHMIAGLMRMVPMEGRGMKMLNFLQTWNSMGSAFGQVPYRIWLETLKHLVPAITSAKSWRITCPNGTDFRGEMKLHGHKPKGKDAGTGDGFTVRTFPLGVCPVIDSMEANGTIAVRWLTPSGIHVFEPNGVELPDTVLVKIENGRAVDFSGSPEAVAKLREYLDFVGEKVGKDPYIVNSWHAGINPRCTAPEGPAAGLDRWMYMAHANPRIVHLHTVGEAQPGEMSVPVLDATIEFDGRKLWENGRLVALDDPALRDQVKAFGDLDFAFHHEQDIGV